MKDWSANLSEDTRRKMAEGSAKAKAAPGNEEKRVEKVKQFWTSMTPEEKQKFIMERSAKRQAVKLSDEGKNAVKQGCLNAWSDPVRKAERLKKYLASRYGR